MQLFDLCVVGVSVVSTAGNPKGWTNLGWTVLKRIGKCAPSAHSTSVQLAQSLMSVVELVRVEMKVNLMVVTFMCCT